MIEGQHNKYRNRTVDLLFSYVAAHAQICAIGVVLRGSLSDGSRGLAAIHLAGGITMVVGTRGTPASGMPSNATDYDGPIDFIGSINEVQAKSSTRSQTRVLRQHKLLEVCETV